MPGRHGVSSRPERDDDPGTTTRSVRVVGASLLGCATVVAAGLFGLTGTANAPDSPDEVSAVPELSEPDLSEREVSQADRSTDRGALPVPKSLRSVLKGVLDLAPDTAADPTSSATAPPTDPNVKPVATAPLPPNSGSGYRVVFDITEQQVWLVDETETVVRTYLVSGSRYDQLPVGSYEVFSRSRHATSYHLTETMEFMVRFHRGENSNIGFHDIPVDKATGTELQTLSQLGTPLSAGCIRQDEPDAVALWEFAPVGTTIVVFRT